MIAGPATRFADRAFDVIKHWLGPILVMIAAAQANAATFNVLCDGETERTSQQCTIRLSGVIERGDARRLLDVIRQPLEDDWSYGTLLLSSPGGDVKEALSMVSIVREAMLKTSTVRLDAMRNMTIKQDMGGVLHKCVSACFLVWIAGTERFGYSTGNDRPGTGGIGLHRPSFAPSGYEGSPAKIAEAQQEMTAEIRGYLHREQVPEELVQKMLDRSSRSIYWLEEREVDALDGKAAWFEEMMISRCNYDPEYDARSEAATAKRLREAADKARATGRKFTPPQETADYRRWLKWRQAYNRCEYKIRREAQATMRR